MPRPRPSRPRLSQHHRGRFAPSPGVSLRTADGCGPPSPHLVSVSQAAPQPLPCGPHKPAPVAAWAAGQEVMGPGQVAAPKGGTPVFRRRVSKPCAQLGVKGCANPLSPRQLKYRVLTTAVGTKGDPAVSGPRTQTKQYWRGNSALC